MKIAVADATPIDELDPQLERRGRAADEVVLVDPEQPIEILQVRDGRFADADRPDRL
jgi:hypothetical protein